MNTLNYEVPHCGKLSTWKKGMLANETITIGSNSYEKVKSFKYLGYLLTNQNSIDEEIKCRRKARNSCYYSVQALRLFNVYLRV